MLLIFLNHISLRTCTTTNSHTGKTLLIRTIDAKFNLCLITVKQRKLFWGHAETIVNTSSYVIYLRLCYWQVLVLLIFVHICSSLFLMATKNIIWESVWIRSFPVSVTLVAVQLNIVELNMLTAILQFETHMKEKRFWLDDYHIDDFSIYDTAAGRCDIKTTKLFR